jgi:3-dehydroquinate dehydratase-2
VSNINILVLQGANMVALGKRQPELYGTTTAAELYPLMLEEATCLGVTLDIR